MKFTCDECNGEGSVVIDVADGGELGGVPIESKCHKCNGKGIIEE